MSSYTEVLGPSTPTSIRQPGVRLSWKTLEGVNARTSSSMRLQITCGPGQCLSTAGRRPYLVMAPVSRPSQSCVWRMQHCGLHYYGKTRPHMTLHSAEVAHGHSTCDPHAHAREIGDYRHTAAFLQQHPQQAGYIRMQLAARHQAQDDMICQCSYAQLGAGYGVSDAATATVARAHSETTTFMNAEGVGEVVLGPSTSQLLENLGRCYSSVLGPGDEVSMPLTVQSLASRHVNAYRGNPVNRRWNSICRARTHQPPRRYRPLLNRWGLASCARGVLLLNPHSPHKCRSSCKSRVTRRTRGPGTRPRSGAGPRSGSGAWTRTAARPGWMTCAKWSDPPRSWWRSCTSATSSAR